MNLLQTVMTFVVWYKTCFILVLLVFHQYIDQLQTRPVNHWLQQEPEENWELLCWLTNSSVAVELLTLPDFLHVLPEILRRNL